MREYLALLAGELESHKSCESNGIDQGIHNVLVYKTRPALFDLHPNRERVLTMGYVPKPSGLQLAREPGRAVLHQYDRHKDVNTWVLAHVQSLSPAAGMPRP